MILHEKIIKIFLCTSKVRLFWTDVLRTSYTVTIDFFMFVKIIWLALERKAICVAPICSPVMRAQEGGCSVSYISKPFSPQAAKTDPSFKKQTSV
jgi:hypothetical protein